jgi:hypothetical protein
MFLSWRSGVVVVGALAVTLSTARAQAPTFSRAERNAYTLDATRRLPTLDRGDAERILASPWPPPRRRPQDARSAEREADRQLVEATCEADLVATGRVESATAFPHANGRWILTAHDLTLTRVVRARHPKAPSPDRVRYIHPGGRLTVAGRLVTATVDRFPALAGDEDLLFFLVRIAKGVYRTTLRLPPLALRAGVLRDLAPPSAAGGRLALDGSSAPNVLRAIAGVTCPRRPPRSFSDDDAPWPTPPIDATMREPPW